MLLRWFSEGNSSLSALQLQIAVLAVLADVGVGGSNTFSLFSSSGLVVRVWVVK